MSKYAITTTLNDKFFYPFKYMMGSLMYHNDLSDVDIIINDLGLNEENKSFIKEKLSAKIRSIPYKNYYIKENIGVDYLGKITKTKEPLNYYKFEIFNLPEYDKVLHIDSDCIILKNIKNLFNDYNNYPLYAVQDHLSNGIKKFNMGIMLVNNYLFDPKKWYANLIENIVVYGGVNGCTKTGESDQAVINSIYFDKIGQLPKNYNERNCLFEDTNIMHFAGYIKPWYKECDEPVDMGKYKRSIKIWEYLTEKYKNCVIK